MNKNFDYFEMLKEMSSINADSIKKIFNGQAISKEKIDFFSLREEFFALLLKEFISPIEREDFYNLLAVLEDEFVLIYSFSLLKTRKNSKNIFLRDKLLIFTNETVKVFEELKNFRSPKKLLKIVNENKKNLQNTIFQIFKSDLFSEENTAENLIFSDLFKTLYKINTETEKIILKNN